jgi:predicted transcriptional regulator
MSKPASKSQSHLSVRLPDALRHRLDAASARTNRSRSYLVQEALKRHLSEIDVGDAEPRSRSSIQEIIGMAGSGARYAGWRSPEEIDAYIRWLRGD